jgi:hypothetical protein
LTPQTGNTTLVKFGGRNITSPLKYLPSKKKKMREIDSIILKLTLATGFKYLFKP